MNQYYYRLVLYGLHNFFFGFLLFMDLVIVVPLPLCLTHLPLLSFLRLFWNFWFKYLSVNKNHLIKQLSQNGSKNCLYSCNVAMSFEHEFLMLILQTLQKNGSKAAFLKRGHKAKKRGYSPNWAIAAFI